MRKQVKIKEECAKFDKKSAGKKGHEDFSKRQYF